jgi:protoheme IX farnesyltransferase
MQRTKNRPLASGRMSSPSAILFAFCLGIMGNLVLIFNTNLLTVVVANIGFLVYVLLYSLWKCRTVYGTAIGSIAGAVPPLVGYCAVSNQFDSGGIILFIMLVLWQMPHFFAIALWRLDDYTAAKIPVLPIVKGMYRTKIHMVIYIVSFIATALMLTLFEYTGYVYLSVTLCMGLLWLGLCIQGFKSDDERFACP